MFSTLIIIMLDCVKYVEPYNIYEMLPAFIPSLRYWSGS